jgi:hypothetical protein
MVHYMVHYGRGHERALQWPHPAQQIGPAVVGAVTAVHTRGSAMRISEHTIVALMMGTALLAAPALAFDCASLAASAMATAARLPLAGL